MVDMEEMKKTKTKRGKTFLPARDRHRALRPAERRGLQRPRFRPGWSPCPAWGPGYYHAITVNTTARGLQNYIEHRSREMGNITG